jgi:hypothetical protein
LSLGETGRAILCAGAPRAWAGPRRPCRRRDTAPNAQGERMTDGAAMRQAGAARWRFFIVRLLRTVPPELSFLGARPNQEQKCWSAGHWPMSGPISAQRVCARDSLMPWTATRSTPVMRRIWARVLPAGAFWRCEWGWRRGGVGEAGRAGGREARPEDGDGACDLGVARAERAWVAIEERQRVSAATQMLRAPGPGQGQRHLLRLLRAAVMAQSRQGRRSTLPRDDGPDHPQSGGGPCHRSARATPGYSSVTGPFAWAREGARDVRGVGRDGVTAAAAPRSPRQDETRRTITRSGGAGSGSPGRRAPPSSGLARA